MTSFFRIILLIGFATSALARTEIIPPIPVVVGGVQYEDARWTYGNEYIVTANYTVPAGVTLSVEPGVIVSFNQGINLFVNGRLLAEGTADRRIQFSRSAANTNRWGNIEFNGTPGSPESRLSYAHIAFNGKKAINCNRASVYFDHLTFGSADFQYIDLDESSFIISNCHFPNATLPFELLHGSDGIRAGGHGMVANNFFGSTVGYNDAFDFTGGNRPQPIIHIIGNVFSGSSDDGLDLDGTDAWIEGNIFLHVHRNGGTPDSAGAISGGNYGFLTSEITVAGNLFFDCDQAATAKQGNFFTMVNNTIVRMTRTGGVDDGDGAITVRDLLPVPTTFGAGFYLEGNVIFDVTQLVRNYSPVDGIVTFTNNILPVAWSGPGDNNLVGDPLLKKIPQVSETYFTNWADAQVMWDWFSLQPNSPGKGTGPAGEDQGGVLPLGVRISGEPSSKTTSREAILQVGFNRTGNGISAAYWPEGSGYTHYKWRLDGGAWSSETIIATPIMLANLAPGEHYVEVSGKRDSGLYQDDPLFGPVATVTRSATWTVLPGGSEIRIGLIRRTANEVEIRFNATQAKEYEVQARDSFDAAHPWVKVLQFTAAATSEMTFTEPVPERQTRFYRIARKE